jgi:cell surface protein SprA
MSLKFPLTITPWSTSTDKYSIWPEANNFDVVLEELVAAKQARNLAGIPLNQPFSYPSSTNGKITIVGNPDLGNVVTAMLGVRNPMSCGDESEDDRESKSLEVWFDELRLSGFNEEGGYAAIARADIRLADFGTVALSGSLHTIGFGQLEQQLNERYRDNYNQYDAATTLELGRFFPKNIGIKLPMYAGISKAISNPQYDPYDHDILLKDKLNLIDDPAARTAARQAAQTYGSIASLNFTNVRKISTGKKLKASYLLTGKPELHLRLHTKLHP